MAIYFDTSALPHKGFLQSLEMSAILAVAGEHRQRLVLPRLVFEESVANRRRRIVAAMRDLTKATDELRSYGLARPEWTPAVNEAATKWEQSLQARFEVIELPASCAEEALYREINRVAPTRDGRGARDAAIWLSIKSDHLTRSARGYFVSQNHKDFSAADDADLLDPDLAAEVRDYDPPLIYCSSLASLLSHLAELLPTPPILEQLKQEVALREAVLSRIKAPETMCELSDLPVLSGVGSWFFGPIKSLELVGLSESRVYQVQDRQLAIVTTDWRLEFTAMHWLISNGNIDIETIQSAYLHLCSCGFVKAWTARWR